MRLHDFVIHAAELILKMDGDDTLTLHDSSLSKTIKVSVTLEKVEVVGCWDGMNRVKKPYWTKELEEVILKLVKDQAAHMYAEQAEQDRIEYERKCWEFQDRVTNWSGSMAGH